MKEKRTRQDKKEREDEEDETRQKKKIERRDDERGETRQEDKRRRKRRFKTRQEKRREKREDEDVNYLSERQEIFRGMVKDKIRMQCRATEKCYEQIFEEMKELEEKKTEETLLLVQRKYDLWRYQNERDEARLISERKR